MESESGLGNKGNVGVCARTITLWGERERKKKSFEVSLSLLGRRRSVRFAGHANIAPFLFLEERKKEKLQKK